MAEPVRREPGLHLVIGERGIVLRSAPIRNAPRRGLQPPMLTAEGLDRIDRPGGPKALPSELVLDVLGRNGRVLDSFGWPWTAEAFYDRPHDKGNEGLPAGRIEVRQTLRILRVPVASSAAFLLFSRSSLSLGKDSRKGTVTRGGLSLYSLLSGIRPGESALPRFPGFAIGLGARPLPGRVPLRGTRER